MNLFVYGSLISEHNQKIVAGKIFKREKAVLKNFRKVTSKACFPFIIPYKHSIVDGYVLFDIDDEAMHKIDKYEAEGDLYWRKTVEATLLSDKGESLVSCQVYVGNVKSIKKYFLPGTDVEDRIEKYIGTKIDELILENIPNEEVQETHYNLEETRRIKKELFGADFEDLLHTHIENQNLPLEYLTKKLAKKNLPSLKKIHSNPDIMLYANNYISFGVKHMIFNQVEDRIIADFKGNVKVKEEFYMHTISVMIALAFMNDNQAKIQAMMEYYCVNLFNEKWEYTDYTDKAIKIVDAVYDREEIARYIETVKKNRHEGSIPLGAEVEFSTVGRYAVEHEKMVDPVYNNFHYFHDFDFTGRMWKLGGHIDDHKFPDPLMSRSFGFLEYAFGRSKIYEDISKPATLDPWVLNRLINEAAKFSGIRPHSLHISIQPPKKIQFTQQNDINHLICLLLLGGDLGMDSNQKLREKRIYNKEIVDKNGYVRFSLENIHFQDIEKVHKTTVIEYQFPRLYASHNNQPLIMALKGYQVAKNPRPLCPAEDLTNVADYEMGKLMSWASAPTPLPDKKIYEFVNIIEDGLMNENNGLPVHKITYI
ncbi:gamma-glutamylcyclotransferase, partial [bacterium]|nr:gamma-glutamylcyclotransferase [bacterium]